MSANRCDFRELRLRCTKNGSPQSGCSGMHTISGERVAKAFLKYMQREGTTMTRERCEAKLRSQDQIESVSR